MCCGQVARRLSDAEAKDLYRRYGEGEFKWHLCAEYRIGTPEFERAYERGNQLSSWPCRENTLAGPITHVEAL